MFLLLKSLSVYGFKSFAEKTQLEFGQGVTAIVGPNGSGKSNISDAIRWILGEQSAKTLRGSKMEDIIFAGSSGRKPLGIAEASLVFDNSDGKLALDYNEVVITRRVFRSGESEYFINKANCRLKDIYELFAGTGVGRDTMTVIGQNKVDEILSSKPDERRLLFEDAAGIAKYKQRKKDALRKLEATEQNLVRLNDISSEIENQLEPLAASAAKTARFNELNASLKAAQLTILLDRLERAEKMVQSAREEKAAFGDEAILLDTNLSLSDAEKEKQTLAAYHLEEELTGIEEQIKNADTEQERLAGKEALLNERVEQGESFKERLNEETSRAQKELTRIAAQLTKLRQTLSARKVQSEVTVEQLCAKNERQSLLWQSVQEADEKIRSGKEKTFDHLQQVVNERNNLKTWQRDLDNLSIRQKNLAAEAAAYEEQKEKNLLLLNECTQERENFLEKTASNKEKIFTVAAQKEKLQTVFSFCQQEEAAITKKTNETLSRLNVLVSMQKDLEGFGRAIRETLKSSHAWRGGICGAVAQLIKVKDEYVTAVEMALGGALKHIVTIDDKTAKEAIAFLKENKLGRATFLPLNTIRHITPRENEKIAAKSQGALGFLSEFVSVEEKYRQAAAFLLGRTILAQDIDAALKIAKAASFAIRLVTLEGELINPGGSITGGSASDKEAGFLARESKIKNFRQDLDKYRLELSAKEKDLSKIKEELTELAAKSDFLLQDNREVEIKLAELAVHLEKAQGQKERLVFAAQTIEAEISAVSAEEKELAEKITTGKNNLLLFESRDLEQKTQINDWEESLKNFKKEQEFIQNEITEIKIKLTSLTHQTETLSANCHSYEENEISLQNQLERLSREENANLAKIAEAEAEIIKIGERRESIAQNKKELTEKRQQGYAQKLELLADIQKIEKEQKEMRRKSAEMQKRLHEAELLFTKYEAVAAHVVEEITNSFALSLEAAKKLRLQEKTELLSQKAASLEREIDDLGPVNPAAIEEYEKVSARYTFLKEQRQDLADAKDYLNSIIREMDETMSKQFLNAFRAINKHFAVVFARLFGGGTAKLELVEPENILGTGIEIIVEPPGKKLQNLALLSGGERALTVIALLFSFLAYRPAPFCVIDEIDASLDEANVNRFGDFLKGYAVTTQFIIVTHRKGTMEAADVLHGITMEESGISRLVSVKLMDKAG